MIKLNIYNIALTGSLIAALFIRPVLAQDGAALYKPCAACHSIGEGRRVGPDLKGITKLRTNDWLIKFIQSPVTVLNSGDADAAALFKEFNNVPMPDNKLTPEQINAILNYIDGDSGKTSVDPKLAAQQRRIDSIIQTNSQQDILSGYALFNGELRFQNNGVACVSCHNATYNAKGVGGTVAKDLTKSFSRLGGFAGIKGIIAMPPFPAMTEAYKNRSVTDEENAYLQLFLKSTDDQNPIQPVIQKTWFFQSAITVGTLIVLGILLLWFKRKRKSVNYVILNRQKRYSK